MRRVLLRAHPEVTSPTSASERLLRWNMRDEGRRVERNDASEECGKP